MKVCIPAVSHFVELNQSHSDISQVFLYFFEPTFFSFQSGSGRASYGSLWKKVGGVVVCRHGEEAHSDSPDDPVSNVMTADRTEPEPGPPSHFPLSTCLLDLHAQRKRLFSGIMCLRGAPELWEV